MLGGCLNPPGQIFNIENNLSHFFTQQSYKLFGDVVLSHVYYLTFTFTITHGIGNPSIYAGLLILRFFLRNLLLLFA